VRTNELSKSLPVGMAHNVPRLHAVGEAAQNDQFSRG
jgi:hypothetical protein